MDKVLPETANFQREAAYQRRLARDADAANTEAAESRRQRILRALADVDAGRLIDDEAMAAWVDSLGTDRKLPVPQPPG